MKRILAALLVAVALAVGASVGGAHGAGPPPPPPPGGGSPLPTIPPPCPIAGCPTATPTATLVPTATATATATPTATATSTPIPLFVHIKLAHKVVAVGAKQKVTVTTVPGMTLHIVVFFPNHRKKTHNATVGSTGVSTWTYKQPSKRTTRKSRTAKVTATVLDASGESVKASKKYKIR